MIVKWQDTKEDIELKSWSHGTLYGIDGQKMWQDMWQDAESVKRVRQIDIVGKRSWYRYQQGNTSASK